MKFTTSMKIDTIILDLGGVLLNIDYDAPKRAFEKLGIENFDQLFTQAKQNSLFDDFEKGNISNEDFRNGIRKISGKNIPDHEIDFAWNSILLDLPEFKLKLLNELKQNYRLFLLSNTNNIHIPVFEKSMNEKFGNQVFHSYFEKIYYSSQVKLRKPDREIFELVLNEQDLIPENTLFIDDSIQHVEGALKSGIRAYHLDLKKEDLPDLLRRENII